MSISKDDKEELFKIYSEVDTRTYTIYLSDSVEHESQNYAELLYTLDSAKEGDEIEFHLANFGGAVHSGLRLAHTIRNSAAFITMIVDAPCYSMGAILALAGHYLIIRPGAMLMFHNYSGLMEGKSKELKSQIINYGHHFEYSLKYFCEPFLVDKEIQLILMDQDIYVRHDGSSEYFDMKTGKSHAIKIPLEERIKRHFKIEESKE